MKLRSFLGIIWFACMVGALSTYFFYPEFFQNGFARIASVSIYLAYAIMLLFGFIRGFTLIPVTYLIILGLLFLKPLPLLIIILSGIVVSSISIYYFFEFLKLDTYFEKYHSKQIRKIKSVLEKNELLVIIVWSAMPFLPTDVICYICGTLKVDIKKLLIGVLIGEGIICTLYIYFGQRLLQYL